MNARHPRVAIAVFSTLAVFALAFVDLGHNAPGEISAVHDREEGLAGDCSDCHGGWGTSMTEACVECHAPIGEQLATREGLHGVLDESTANQCGQCHGEHYGADFPIVNVRSFALAGVHDVQAFDHERIGFAMYGAHLELDCVECHVNATATLLPKGELRYLGLDQDCATCHEDPHEGRMAVACVDCHGQEAFDAIAPPDHDRDLPLVGGHADISCRECHAEGEPHALEALGREEESPADRDCLACHESPHDPRFVDGIAMLVEQTPGASCAHCHEAEHVEFRSEDVAVSALEHAISGFALDPPHDEAACADCHAEGEADFAARYPGRGQEQCSACHDDPHGGQFAAGPFASQECTACHDTQHFEPHSFGVELHARASLALEGAHLDAECSACHLDPSKDEPRLFHGVDDTCESCHADAHLGFFDQYALELAEAEHGECASCHGADSFSDLPADGFDHSRWTGFPIRDAHAQEECESCHPRVEHADERGRTFGRVAEHFGPFTGCVTCHVDPHEGRFDGAKMACEVEGREGCARCHSETSFRVLAPNFDHGTWTGHALDGAHLRIECSACHAPLRTKGPLGRTWAAAKGTRCEDCHADVHAGQFEQEGAGDCERCHQSAESFATLVFDHERDSRFALGEAHSPLACSACHHAGPVDGAVVRYRPLPHKCVDCHGRQDHPLRRIRGRKG